MADQPIVTEDQVWDALREVPDPEIPTVSVVDLGVILRVELDQAAGHARVLLMPTFTGCRRSIDPAPHPVARAAGGARR